MNQLIAMKSHFKPLTFEATLANRPELTLSSMSPFGVRCSFALIVMRKDAVVAAREIYSGSAKGAAPPSKNEIVAI